MPFVSLCTLWALTVRLIIGASTSRFNLKLRKDAEIVKLSLCWVSGLFLVLQGLDKLGNRDLYTADSFEGLLWNEFSYVLCALYGSQIRQWKADSHFHFVSNLPHRTCYLYNESSKDKGKLLLVSKMILPFAYLNIFSSMHLQYMFRIKSRQL